MYVTERAIEENQYLKKYLEEIGRIPLLKREQESELAPKAQKGDSKAIQKLVRSNLRFVVMIAREYQDHGLSLNDLINEGNLGLMEAARRFDSTRGTKFISYAVWWVRQAILQALANHARMVRLPINQVWARNRMSKISESLVQSLGRDPSVDEIATKLDTDSVDLLKNMRTWGRDVSLDESFGWDNDDVRMVDRLSDTQEPLPDEPLFDEAMRTEIDDVLASLESREEEVMRLFFGIKGSRPLTLGEIGEIMDLSRERIRQIKNKALRKLRHASRRERLRPYLG